jgi:ferredoxin/flavodoxin---NADP+ reductase
MAKENNEITYLSHILMSNKIIEDGVHLLSFKRKFDFLPGQVVAITLDFTIEPRLYSIASGDKSPQLDILFDVKPEGQLTNRLAKLLPGEPVYISNPIGTFTCDIGKAYWIAAGTGIAPYASMYLSGNSENKTLIHGGRSLNSFYFQDDFRLGLKDKYIRCCSRETGEGIFDGRLTDYLKQQEYLDPDQMYYLCGSAEMIVDTRQILITKGIPFEKIMAEIYF